MNKKIVEKLEEKDLELLPVDQETVELIKKATESTHANPRSVVHEAMKVFEKCLGREVIVKEENSNWELVIKKYKSYKPISKLEPDSK